MRQTRRRQVARGRRRDLPGNVKLTGQVPLAVAKIPGAAASHRAGYVRPHPESADIGLSFAFPLRDKAGLDQLIAQEARTHQYLTRAQIYARFAPPAAQVNALRSWLIGRGFRVTHIGADRMAITAYAPTAVVEKTLHVKINDYLKPASTFGKLQGAAVSVLREHDRADGPGALRGADDLRA